jgi:hypothetical protein
VCGNRTQKSMKAICPLFLACVSCASVCSADTLLFSNGSIVSGKVIQTNREEVLLLTSYAAYNYSRAGLKEIKINPEEITPTTKTNRLPDFKNSIAILSNQAWATNITAIPATVIDRGILKNVPYSSFQCGENYEVNVYGDLDHPAGIEIGFYKTLVDDSSRQSNCIRFMSDLFGKAADRALVPTLDLKKDMKTLEGLTFEITPPNADDSYNGWWVSVYSEKQLSLARASDAEMKYLSVAKVDAANQARLGDSSQWSADELKLSRPSVPAIMTFTNKYGDVISNAAVRIYEPGVSIIWDKGVSGGVVKLADLPKDVRERFGYDPTKARVAAESEKEKKLRREQALAAEAAQQTQQSHDATSTKGSSTLQQFGDPGFIPSGNYSGGGFVYVHGYTRSNGTYVSGYTRRR